MSNQAFIHSLINEPEQTNTASAHAPQYHRANDVTTCDSAHPELPSDRGSAEQRWYLSLQQEFDDTLQKSYLASEAQLVALQEQILELRNAKGPLRDFSALRDAIHNLQLSSCSGRHLREDLLLERLIDHDRDLIGQSRELQYERSELHTDAELFKQRLDDGQRLRRKSDVQQLILQLNDFFDFHHAHIAMMQRCLAPASDRLTEQDWRLIALGLSERDPQIILSDRIIEQIATLTAAGTGPAPATREQSTSPAPLRNVDATGEDSATQQYIEQLVDDRQSVTQEKNATAASGGDTSANGTHTEPHTANQSWLSELATIATNSAREAWQENTAAYYDAIDNRSDLTLGELPKKILENNLQFSARGWQRAKNMLAKNSGSKR